MYRVQIWSEVGQNTFRWPRSHRVKAETSRSRDSVQLFSLKGLRVTGAQRAMRGAAVLVLVALAALSAHALARPPDVGAATHDISSPSRLPLEHELRRYVQGMCCRVATSLACVAVSQRALRAIRAPCEEG